MEEIYIAGVGMTPFGRMLDVDIKTLTRQATQAALADAVLPHWAYVTADDVARAHAAGISVAPWATSDPDILRNLIACRVDGIGTNHPDILRGVLAEGGRE